MLLVGGATRSCSKFWIGELLTGLLMVKLLLLLAALCHFVAVVLAPALVVAFLDEQLALRTYMSLHQLLLVLPESPQTLPLLLFLVFFALLSRVHAVHADIGGEQLLLRMV